MNQGIAIGIMNEGIIIQLMLVLPIIGVGLLVGLMISLFQAVTQIQEQTLTFVPKLIVVFVMLMVLAPWIFSSLVNYVIHLWSGIPLYAAP